MITCRSAMTGPYPAGFRQAHGAEGGSQHRPALARPAMGGSGCQTLMPGPRTRSVIHFAIWRGS
jgi:hypothetical protein